MVMNIGLDNDGLKEAINCYLTTRLINAHTYEVDMKIITSRLQDVPGNRAELTLKRKAEFAYLDQAITGTEEVEVVETKTARVPEPLDEDQEVPQEAPFEETEEAPAYMDEPTEVKKTLPTAPMGSLFNKNK